jgi:ribosomal 50S subunit-recycling heat shock protein
MRSILNPLIRDKKKEEVNMRLDKYLKVSRLIKRRTVANEACDAGRVLINDRPAKASANVKAGDVITIQFGNKEVKVEVLDVQETVRKEEAKELFRYLT